MKKIINPISRKVNGLVMNLTGGGILLLILGILVIWNDFLAKIVLGIIILVFAYFLFYGAYKINSIRKDIKKIFPFK